MEYTTLLIFNSLPNTLNNRIIFKLTWETLRSLYRIRLYGLKQINILGIQRQQPINQTQIINSITQNNHILYNVQFFSNFTQQQASQRSCYLQTQQLAQFQSQQMNVSGYQANSQALRQFIEQSAQSLRPITQNPTNQAHNLAEPQVNENHLYDESKQTQKSSSTCLQRNQQKVSNENMVQQSKWHYNPLEQQIDRDNILEHIASSSYKQLRKLKGYTNRKQLLEIEQKYKSILLNKYGLSDIPALQQRSKRRVCGHRSGRSKKINQRKNGNIINLCARKLLGIMTKNYKMDSRQAQIQIIRVFQDWGLQNIQNTKQLSKLYIKFVNRIRENPKILQQADEKTSDFSFYLTPDLEAI